MFKQHKRMAMLQVTIAILLVASISAVSIQLGQAFAQNATGNTTGGAAAGPQAGSPTGPTGPLSGTNASSSPSAVGGGNITSPGTSGTASAGNMTAGMPSSGAPK
jgi:hypothetical protein